MILLSVKCFKIFLIFLSFKIFYSCLFFIACPLSCFLFFFAEKKAIVMLKTKLCFRLVVFRSFFLKLRLSLHAGNIMRQHRCASMYRFIDLLHIERSFPGSHSCTEFSEAFATCLCVWWYWLLSSFTVLYRVISLRLRILMHGFEFQKLAVGGLIKKKY